MLWKYRKFDVISIIIDRRALAFKPCLKNKDHIWHPKINTKCMGQFDCFKIF